MVEAKAAVAIDGLSTDEACAIFREFGYEAESATRIYGGYASSNFKVVGKREGTSSTLLLKINHYSLLVEDLEHQIHVLKHLQTTGFPTNFPHSAADGRMLVEAAGRRSFLLDFVADAIPGSTLIAKGEAYAPFLMNELGCALAQLHETSWPSEPKIRDIRSGYPVCNMGDLLRGDEVAALRTGASFAEHPVIAYAWECTASLREVFDRDLPWGLIHGDGFLDNTLFADDAGGPDSCKLLALIDWEDSCVGPYVLDLAVAASACCFTGTNELLACRLDALLRAYMLRRSLSDLEAAALPDFMAAGALACAFYRFCEFNIRKPDSEQEAKLSWQLHLDRAKLLAAGRAARSEVEAAVKRAQAHKRARS